MYYVNKDFLLLELFSNQELAEEIRHAYTIYDDVQAYLGRLEGEEKERLGALYRGVSRDVFDEYLKNLNNIECYIRKAENLLNKYEPVKLHIKKVNIQLVRDRLLNTKSPLKEGLDTKKEYTISDNEPIKSVKVFEITKLSL